MKKVGVFGGSGFLGSYLLEALIESKYEVVSMDLNQPAAKIEGVIYESCNILERTQITQLFEKHQFNYVYNLAGFANLDKAIQHPVETFQLNVLGNMYILEACREYQITRFVYASSAYAMSNKGSFYGISKLSSEKIIEEYFNKYNLAYTILRYGSIYSEKSFENNYIFNLVEKAIETGKIEHGGDGEEIREYIHAADAANLSVDVIKDDSFAGKHLILTGVERLKRIDLFNLINEILDHKIEIKLTEKGYNNHYKFSPYSFTPENSQKIVPNPYIDMGQGILNCIKEVYKK